MSALDKHVDVQITKETATVSRTGFGTPAVLTYHTNFGDAFRLYGGLDEMATDGFATTDMAYKLAAAIFAQSPRPNNVVVGRRGTPVIRDVKITPRAAVNEFAYSLTIDGETFTYTSDATATIPEITLGLVALINAGTANVLATDNTTDLDIEKAATPGGVATAGVPFLIEYDPQIFELKDNTPTALIATDLLLLENATTDWYGLCTDLYDETNIGVVASTLESFPTPKIYAAESQDYDIIETGSADIASVIKAASYDRTFLTYSPDVDPSKAAAWLGGELPLTPGASTWKFSTLNSATTDALSTGQVNFADGKNCNTYTEVGGNGMMAEGVMASGEFIDVTIFIDWLTARIKEDVFAAMLAVSQTSKVPFTDAGIQSILGVVEGVLRVGVANNGINGDEDLIVTGPRASEVTAADKNSRTLRGVEFIATLAGAIHKSIIRGKLVV